MPKKTVVKTSVPKGLNPPGSTNPIRNHPDKMTATDIPIEVPVFVSYERHMGPPEVGKLRRLGTPLTDMPKASQLLGWTIVVEAFTYGAEIKIKLGHVNHILEVYIIHTEMKDGKRVKVETKVGVINTRLPPGTQLPPCAFPRFDDWYKTNEAKGTLHNEKCGHSGAPVSDDIIVDDIVVDDFEEE